jgi:hypothetical protein
VGRGQERLLERGALEALGSCGAAVRTEVLDPGCDAEDRVPPVALGLLELVARRVAHG